MENDRSTGHSLRRRLTSAFGLALLGVALGWGLAGTALVFAASSAGARDPSESAPAQSLSYSAPRVLIPLHIDRNFPAAEHGQIQSAVEQWNNVMNGTIRFDIVPAPYDFAA